MAAVMVAMPELDGLRAVTAEDAAGGEVRWVSLPVGWEGLSFKLYGKRCIVTDVPKACFSSNASAASGTSQVEGVSQGDEIVTLNGETPVEMMEKIGSEGLMDNEWNVCASSDPPHPVGSKTKFDSPPCAGCDFLRRLKTLGSSVALQMYLKTMKRDRKFTLGVRTGAMVPEEPEWVPEVSVSKASKPGGRMAEAGSLVELKASKESVKTMEDALARLMKLDDAARDMRKKGKGKGKGKGKKGKGKKGKRPTGPDLPRTRVSSELVTGKVVEWKGKFGWIMPTYPIDHPRAKAHRGKLYIHVQDLPEWMDKLNPGNLCRFHVYEDANSLGAEELTALEELEGWDGKSGWEDDDGQWEKGAWEEKKWDEQDWLASEDSAAGDAKWKAEGDHWQAGYDGKWKASDHWRSSDHWSQADALARSRSRSHRRRSRSRSNPRRQSRRRSGKESSRKARGRDTYQ